MSIRTKSVRRRLRAGIVLLIIMELAVGVWQYTFDVAGLGLGFVVALLFAVVSLQHQIVRSSLVVIAAYAAVHFVYQVLHFDGSVTRWVSGALIAEFLLAVGLLALTPRLKPRKANAPSRRAEYRPPRAPQGSITF